MKTAHAAMPLKVAGSEIAGRVSNYETAQRSAKGRGPVLPQEQWGKPETNGAQMWAKKPA
jgi:hypothetical protein